MDQTSPGCGPALDVEAVCVGSKRRKVEKRKSTANKKPRPADVPSCESLKSDRSKNVIDFYRAGSGPSCESLKSDSSKKVIIDFYRHSELRGPAQSMQSDSSKDRPIDFKEATFDDKGDEPGPERPRGDLHLSHIFMELEKNILTFVKQQLSRFYLLLASDYPETLEHEEGQSTEAVLSITVDFMKRMKHEALAERLYNFCFSGKFMSHSEWSAVAFLVLSSDSDLDEFDLRKYHPSIDALLGLLPLVKASTRAILSQCRLTYDSCEFLVPVLSSSTLTHLDLSHNNLRDSGVKILCDGLKSAPCRLLSLSLSHCKLSDRCCEDLASVLGSSGLTHLDLNNNKLMDSGVEQLCVGLKSAPCRLEVLRLSACMVSERGGASLASALGTAHSRLKELDLSYNHPRCSAELLTSVRDDPLCSLHSLLLDPAGKRWMVPGPRKYFCDVTLDPNTANDKLKLSEDKRSVSVVSAGHEGSSAARHQVLSAAAVTGRCYWEVLWSGDVDIAVSLLPNGEREEECVFGDNDQSWSLRLSGDKRSVCHCKREIDVKYYISDRVSVLLDTEAGALSFYTVHSDGDLWHLYSFSCSFTEPVFVGFGLSPGSSVTLLDPNSSP